MTSVVPINGETWLICGGRGFKDAAMFNSAMSDIMSLRGCPCVVVHGAATGADALADEWAHRMAIDVKPEPVASAEWQRFGKAAGPMRNQKMLDHYRPKRVIAFPGGRGTADMVRRARVANVEVIEVATPRDRDGGG